VRATGVAISCGISSAVLGGTAPLVATLLFAAAGASAVPVCVAAIAVAAAVAIARAPETAFAGLEQRGRP
jgi:hypothetical protein